MIALFLRTELGAARFQADLRALLERAGLVLPGASACGSTDAGSGRGAAEEWRRLAAAPLSPRVGHSAVWTGNQLLLWGGTTGQDCADGCPRADGLAYRPGPR